MQYVNWSMTVVIFIVFAVSAAVVGTIRWSRSGAAAAVRTAAAILLLGAVVAVAGLSLLDRYSGYTGVNLVPFCSIAVELGNVNHELAFLNIAGNVAMYVPVGLLVPLAFGVPWFYGVWGGTALSGVMELLQFVLQRAATDIDDVILNGCGAMLGAALVAGVRALVSVDRPPRPAL